MFQFSKKALSVFITIIILSTMLVCGASAFDAAERVNCFRENNSQIVCVAHRGDWHSYPENSAEAVSAAAEYGTVSVDVKITSDGRAVLMADETTDRMCVNDSGAAVTGSVRSYTLDELKTMYLRGANGTANNIKTEFHPASLEDALAAAGDRAALMLSLSCADFAKVYENVKALNALDRVIFRFNDKNKTILETVSGKKDITVCGNYQGNIIFLATGTVKDCLADGINTIELGSKNGHGVLYDNFLMKRFRQNGKAMVSMVGGRCGGRTDSEMGWDDLIARGYSVIETDYPKELSEYLNRCDGAKTELKRCLDMYADTDTAPCTTDTENAFKSAKSEAERLLSGFGSLSEIENARFSLQSAHDNLTIGVKKPVTLSFSFTAGRVIAAVLCGAAILISQILLYKRREKTDK